jgi:hypothetical protein
MSEMNAEQPVQDVELQTALNESVEAVSGYSNDEVQKRGTELAVREHFGGLESAETVRRANALYREFVEEREYDPHPTLVAAVGNAMVHFPGAETTGVIIIKELLDAGDLAVDEAPAKEDLDTIGYYLTGVERFDLGEMDVRKVADALGIPKMVRGLELIHTLASKIEDGEITARLLLDLGIIDSETYEAALAAEEEAIAKEKEGRAAIEEAAKDDSDLTDEDEDEDEDSELDYFGDDDEEAEDVSDVDIL